MSSAYICSPDELPSSDVSYRTDASGSTELLVQGYPLLAHDAAYVDLSKACGVSSVGPPFLLKSCVFFLSQLDTENC